MTGEKSAMAGSAGDGGTSGDCGVGWCMALRKHGLSAGLLVLRLAVGLGMAYHGYGKVFGGVMERFVTGIAGMGFPMPMAFAWLAALSEFGGGLLIAMGLATRVAALFVFITMAVAGFVAHAADPFQIKELAFFYMATALSLLMTGPGCLSIDAYLHSRFCGKK